MADSPFRERRVPPDEVQRILKRAAELALIDPATATAGKALTTAELEQHLKNLGIAEGVVRAAMQPPPTAVTPSADGAIRVERELVVDGMLSPDHFEAIAELITSKMTIPGRTSAVGSKLTWSPTGLLLEPSVTVHARDGRTTIRYVETLASRGQMTVGFGTLATFAGGATGALVTTAGAAIAQSADISRASGAPVVLGIGILLGIGAAVGSFLGLKRTIARRAVKRAAFADQLLADVAQAVKANLAVESPVKARVEASEPSGAEEELEAQAAEERATRARS